MLAHNFNEEGTLGSESAKSVNNRQSNGRLYLGKLIGTWDSVVNFSSVALCNVRAAVLHGLHRCRQC
jgi:hypothetical protein